MQRVVIIGCFGSGKTMFSAELGRLTGLPLHSLDRLFMQLGTPPDREAWGKMQHELAAGDSWIIEGNYGATIDLRLRRADTVVFLDYSTFDCLLGVVCRIVRSRLGGRTGTDIVEGFNERLDLRFLKGVLMFNRRHRKGILKGLARYKGLRAIRIRSRAESRAFLKSLRDPHLT